MIRYTVVWDADVESTFLKVWLASDSRMRSILTEIANWIDAQLAADPETKGWPTSEANVRVLAVPIVISKARVSVTFLVLPQDRQVQVVRIIFR